MRCPDCGLVNPESAERCDCGYEFSERDKSSTTTQRQTIRPGSHSDFLAICIGLAICYFVYGIWSGRWGSQASRAGVWLHEVAFVMGRRQFTIMNLFSVAVVLSFLVLLLIGIVNIVRARGTRARKTYVIGTVVLAAGYVAGAVARAFFD